MRTPPHRKGNGEGEGTRASGQERRRRPRARAATASGKLWRVCVHAAALGAVELVAHNQLRCRAIARVLCARGACRPAGPCCYNCMGVLVRISFGMRASACVCASNGRCVCGARQERGSRRSGGPVNAGCAVQAMVPVGRPRREVNRACGVCEPALGAASECVAITQAIPFLHRPHATYNRISILL
eukprot:4679030-Prymnesium_polylepis.1